MYIYSTGLVHIIDAYAQVFLADLLRRKLIQSPFRILIYFWCQWKSVLWRPAFAVFLHLNENEGNLLIDKSVFQNDTLNKMHFTWVQCPDLVICWFCSYLSWVSQFSLILSWSTIWMKPQMSGIRLWTIRMKASRPIDVTGETSSPRSFAIYLSPAISLPFHSGFNKVIPFI